VEARDHLAGFSEAEIEAQLTRRSQGGLIRSFMSDGEYFVRQEALAHALFERGYFPSRNDLAPTLYVVPSPCEDSEAQRRFRESLREQGQVE
jgi:hypothetical protein